MSVLQHAVFLLKQYKSHTQMSDIQGNLFTLSIMLQFFRKFEQIKSWLKRHPPQSLTSWPIWPNAHKILLLFHIGHQWDLNQSQSLNTQRALVRYWPAGGGWQGSAVDLILKTMSQCAKVCKSSKWCNARWSWSQTLLRVTDTGVINSQMHILR